MRHVYDCPLRWADLDLLGHVNNVAHVDVLQEARVDMLRRHEHVPGSGTPLISGSVVVRLEVDYVAPLRLRRHVRTQTWVSEVRAGAFTLDYEVGAGVTSSDDPDREVVLRARTLLAPYDVEADRPRRLSVEEAEGLRGYLEPGEPCRRAAAPADAAAWRSGELRVRFSDLDVFGHVNNVVYVEYFQEARIRVLRELFAEVPDDVPPPSVVVARLELDYLRPVLLRPEPYVVRTHVESVGRTSYVLVSELVDTVADEVAARGRVVMVGFDAATQRAALLHPAYLEALGAATRDADDGPAVTGGC